ncbi:hypothetical protein FF38_03394 [Lucilia cuprina]|uniref:Uncharacterized protein n=1 Tax=Lucilia cuprina TaxID=7375 RepID=A0A0L0BYZ3_LUCCU|nr:hypothetical protein FF38_03394 [Lucilia cuprina]
MSVVWKGAPNLKLDKLSDTTVVLAIIITSIVAAVLYCIFMLPFLHRKLVLEDWTLKWWEVIYGPLLLRRSKDIPPMPEGHLLVIDYYDKSGKRHKAKKTATPVPADSTQAMAVVFKTESSKFLSLRPMTKRFRKRKRDRSV